MEAQSLSVKRAEVEFHNFASLGDPERAIATYAKENGVRGALIEKHREFIGPMSPFLEIGANVGHTSYLLANEFGADGFALDISADALRYGAALQDRWKMDRAPVRIAGDAANMPFRDGSLRFVMAFQMLSQFMDIESVFLEVKRVLAPGGIFLFAEEPLRRLLTLRLWRTPYYEAMKPWERRLYNWGLLGFLVRDVIGAGQEESFGIRQNHTMHLGVWHDLIQKHFAAQEYEIFVAERGWAERAVKRAAVAMDPYRSVWRAARLLGGTLTAFCRKPGEAGDRTASIENFDQFLRCPDCRGDLARDPGYAVRCAACGFEASSEGGVYNLLPSAERKELYPGDREDLLDFCQPGHESRLLGGWYEVEGIFGNKYRWIGRRASLELRKVGEGPRLLRVRGHAQEGHPVTLTITSNGQGVGVFAVDRPGLFVVETPLPDAPAYRIDLDASPSWRAAGDSRELTVTVSLVRLAPVGE